MRLRRETGDFQIVVDSTAGTVNTIRTGLSAEDLAGELVKVGSSYEPVSSATDGDGTVTFETKSYIFTYTKSTGAIAAQENSGGSGSGSSGLVIEGVTSTHRDVLQTYEISIPDITPNLTPADFVGATMIAERRDTEAGEAVHLTMHEVGIEAGNVDSRDLICIYFGGPLIIDANTAMYGVYLTPVFYNPENGKLTVD